MWLAIGISAKKKCSVTLDKGVKRFKNKREIHEICNLNVSEVYVCTNVKKRILFLFIFLALGCVSRSSGDVRFGTCTSWAKRQSGNDPGFSNLYSGEYMK